MATQSLYRRYRPRRFSELKGQDHVVRALRTAVAEGREGQAYLFSGPRGTGKTTSARILAKVLNCEHPLDGEPCCECTSCVAVERGVSYDVHELDAASNNGVEAMRDLIEKASLGTPGRHKVYILDEVHMLSKAAEAALLKTLEEPPPHVVFVLATTDPQKMSSTVISRTQHLQFHLLASDTLAEHVRWVAADAGLDVSDAAIEQVLTRGGGSARDTLSALELVASTGDDGITNLALDEYVEALIDRDPGRALTMVAHAISMGTDSRTLTEELIGFLRNGFLSLMAPELVQLPSHRLDAVAEQAQRLGAAAIVRGIEQLGSALTEMRHAPDPRVLLDVATVQLTADAAATDVGDLLVRIERLERRVAEGVAAASAAPTPQVDPTTGRATLGGRARSAQPTTGRSPADAPAAPSADVPASTSADAPAGRTGVAASPPSIDATPPIDAPPAEVTAAAVAAGGGTAGGGTAGGVTAGAVTDATPAAGGVEVITVEVWESTVRPMLRGMARAVYGPTTFVASTPTSLTLAVPNAVHLGKCEQQRSTVEAALRQFAGGDVALVLVDGDGGNDGPIERGAAPSAESRAEPSRREAPGSTPITAAEGRASARAATESGTSPFVEDDIVAVVDLSALPDDGDVDLDDVTDAPPESVKTPIDRLAEAFPGSELIEDVG